MKIPTLLGLIFCTLPAPRAFAFHGIGPVIPAKAVLNCEKLGGGLKAVTLDHDTRSMCVVPKEELRANMVELRLIPRHASADDACDFWQEKDEPNPGRVNCEISPFALFRNL
ncbi:MAG: hypothetical protein ACXVB9_16705 [Bdellovibrionota bacterium]